jgi:hypothetical protein
MPILIGDSRIIGRSEVDEQQYHDNVGYDMIRALAREARSHGELALEDIQLAMERTMPADVMFYAYFAGVRARRAITIARLAQELNDKRQCPLSIGSITA